MQYNRVSSMDIPLYERPPKVYIHLGIQHIEHPEYLIVTNQSIKITYGLNFPLTSHSSALTQSNRQEPWNNQSTPFKSKLTWTPTDSVKMGPPSRITSLPKKYTCSHSKSTRSTKKHQPIGANQLPQNHLTLRHETLLLHSSHLQIFITQASSLST